MAYRRGMKPARSPLSLLALVGLLAAAVLGSGRWLPPLVASHFDASGAADGFMPRGLYLALMCGMVLGVPLLVAFLPRWSMGPGGARLNIRHRAYWLAPERRDETLAFVQAHGRWFAAAIALFLAYVHWLVVRANGVQPPALSMPAFYAGFAAFLGAVGAWLRVLHVRFRAPG